LFYFVTFTSVTKIEGETYIFIKEGKKGEFVEIK